MEMQKFTQKINEELASGTFKLGLDYHGVIDAIPGTFAFLSNAIVNAGGEVHILTGSSWTDELTEDLKSKGITWSHSFSIYDYLVDSDEQVIGEIQFPDGKKQLKYRDTAWDNVKGIYCRSHNISLHIDDTLIYNDHFATPFARLWTHNNRPKKAHKDQRHLD